MANIMSLDEASVACFRALTSGVAGTPNGLRLVKVEAAAGPAATALIRDLALRLGQTKGGTCFAPAADSEAAGAERAGAERAGAPVLVVCASAQAAKTMRARLETAGLTAGAQVDVATPYQLATRVLAQKDSVFSGAVSSDGVRAAGAPAATIAPVAPAAPAAPAGGALTLSCSAARVISTAEKKVLIRDMSQACEGLDLESAAKAVALYEAKRSACEEVKVRPGSVADRALVYMGSWLNRLGGVLRGDLSARALEALEGLQTTASCEAQTVRDIQAARADAARADQPARASLAYDWVLVNDAQSMSVATLSLCLACANVGALVVGDEAAAIHLGDPCPMPQAFRAFQDAHPGVLSLVVDGSSLVSDSVNRGIFALRQQTGVQPLGVEPAFDSPETQGQAADDALVCVKWRDPVDEAVGVARMARRYMNQDGYEPGDVFVAVPTKAWARRMASGAAKRALDASVLTGPVCLGDPADAAAGFAATTANPADRDSVASIEAFALLCLAANPKDLVAWRLWCALPGEASCASEDPCNSRAWLDLEKATDQEGCSFLEVLESGRFAMLTQRFQEGLHALDRMKELRGLSLIAWMTRRNDSLQTLFPDLAPEDGAKEALVGVLEYEHDPVFPDTMCEVRVGTLRYAHGLEPKLMVVAGAVDGMLPAADKPTQAERQLRELYVAAGQSRDSLVFSRPQKAEAQLAQRCHMQAARFKSERGVRMAMLTRSSFVDGAGDWMPGDVSGEQLLQLLG